MPNIPRRVISLLKDNAPMKRSVIMNPTFASQGYGLTFFCMDTDTSTPAERLHRSSLYMVLQGELLIEIHDRTPYRTIVLHPGEVFVRHTGVLIGFRAAMPCICLEQGFDDTVPFVESINFAEVFKLDDWLSYTGPEAYRTITNGSVLFGRFLGFKEGTEFSNDVKRGIGMLMCIEGKVELKVGEKTIMMNPWDAVFVTPYRYPLMNVRILEDTRALGLWKLY